MDILVIQTTCLLSNVREAQCGGVGACFHWEGTSAACGCNRAAEAIWRRAEDNLNALLLSFARPFILTL